MRPADRPITQTHKQTALIPINELSVNDLCVCACVRCDWTEAAGRKSILPVRISPALSDPHYHSRPAFVLRQTHSFCTNCFPLVISPTKAYNTETTPETTKTQVTYLLFYSTTSLTCLCMFICHKCIFKEAVSNRKHWKRTKTLWNYIPQPTIFNIHWLGGWEGWKGR